MKSIITTENQLNLQVVPGVSIVGRSLVVTEKADFEQVSEALSALVALDDVSQWCIGDLINAAEAKFGEKYSQMLDITGLKYQTLMTYSSMSNKFEPSERRNISFDHHRIVQKFDKEKRARYLQIAIDNNMRLGEFRNYVNSLEGKKKKNQSGGEDDRDKKYVAALKTVPVNRGDLWEILSDDHSVHLREEDLAMLGIPLPKAVDSVLVIGIRYEEDMQDADQEQNQAQMDLDDLPLEEPEVPFG